MVSLAEVRYESSSAVPHANLPLEILSAPQGISQADECSSQQTIKGAQAEFVPVRIAKLAGQKSAAADAAGCWRYLLEWRRTGVGSLAVRSAPCKCCRAIFLLVKAFSSLWAASEPQACAVAGVCGRRAPPLAPLAPLPPPTTPTPPVDDPSHQSF